MNAFPSIQLDELTEKNHPALCDRPVDRAHADHVLRLAQQLADGTRPGILSTVDAFGTPQLRWMSTLSLQQFPHLYALTSPMSRKVAQIQKNPRVSWLFTSDINTIVVTLIGRATIVTAPCVVNRVWRMVEDKSRAYFLNLDTQSDGVAVIDTVIENIECVIPQYDLHYPTP